MKADDIEIAQYAMPVAVETTGNGRCIALAGGNTLGPFDEVIWAIGRVPNTEGLGLADAGVTLGPGGEIATDFRQDTNVAGIHALGDVTGRAD